MTPFFLRSASACSAAFRRSSFFCCCHFVKTSCVMGVFASTLDLSSSMTSSMSFRFAASSAISSCVNMEA